MGELELCCECSSPTGKAGRDEDSIYYLDSLGPFCEDCHDRLGAEVIANLGLTTLQHEVERQAAEVDELVTDNGQLAKTCRKLRGEVERLKASEQSYDIVFDGPPGPVAGRFVEVESPPGTGVSLGEWVERDDGYWVLRIDVPAQLATMKTERDEAQTRLNEIGRIHRKFTEKVPVCELCGQVWPCRTHRLATGEGRK